MAGDKVRILFSFSVVLVLSLVNGMFFAGFCFCQLWLVYCEKRAEDETFHFTFETIRVAFFGTASVVFPQIAWIFVIYIILIVAIGQPKIRNMKRIANL